MPRQQHALPLGAGAQMEAESSGAQMASGVILGSHQVHLYRSIAGAAPPDALNIVFGGPQIILWKPDANVETGKPLWKPLWKLLGKCWKPWNPYYIKKENTHTLSLF